MSGDVQPRKRKDKRRKKGQLEAKRSEEYMEESAVFRRQSSAASDHHSFVHHTDRPSSTRVKPDEEDLHHAGSTGPEEIIHIQKDLVLGGNICAKIVFFCLLGALGVMVGLIITEYRGSSEAETQSALDSPWSLWLDGWIDDSPSHHEAEVVTGEIEDDHDNSEEEINSKEDEDSNEDDSREEDDKDNDDSHEDENGNDSEDDVSESHEDEEEEEENLSNEDYNNSEEEENISSEDYNSEEEENVSDDEDDNNEEEDESEEQEQDGSEEEDNETYMSDIEKAEESEENQSEEDNKSEGLYNSHLKDSEENLSDEIDERDLDDKDSEEEYERDESLEIDESVEEDDSVEENESDQSYEIVKKVENRKKDKRDKIHDSSESLKFGSKNRWFLKRIKERRGQGAEDKEHTRKFPDVTDAEKNPRKLTTSSSEELQDEVAKISEILRRTSNKMKKAELMEDDEEETEKEVEKVEEKDVEVQEEESPIYEEVEDIEKEEETSGGKATLEQQDPNETEEGEILPDIVRRQTLIPPTEELPASPDQNYEYSEGEEEDEEEEEEDEEELVRKTYEDLRAKYEQQTPEGSDIEPTEEDFATKTPDTYDYSPTPPESEPEEEPTESDVEEEEDEEEDPMAEWKQRGPALLAEEVEDVQTGSESEDEPPPPPPVVPLRRGGPLGIGEEDYENADITNEADWEIKEDLDFADAEFDDEKPAVALSKFTALLVRYPHSPRALYGKAKALDQLAEKQKSNQLLASAINTYLEALELPDVPDKLFLRLANRTIDRMRFRGLHLQAVGVHNKLIARYHNISMHRIELAITYMMINRLDNAKLVLKSSLDRWPDDGLTLAYYGLVLKLQGKHEESIPYLQKGLDSQAPGTNNSHFYFHLGDTLHRKGQIDKAMELYEKGASNGLFRSKYQRSLYNVDHLTAQPWWSIEETTYTQFFRKLEDNWKTIRDEGIAALKAQKGFLDETESLQDTGKWKQFEIFARGQKHRNNCNQTPVTCRLIDDFKPASNCRRGQSKFSVMEGGTHVWAHCGPTNCRLRAHLGLVIPNGTAIRVADTIRNWSEGKVLIFDDSFEHEVWHNGTENRLVLIVDVWHPELTTEERLTLTAI